MDKCTERLQRIKELQKIARRADMTHISEPLDSVLSDLVVRACEAGNPPSFLQIGGYNTNAIDS